MGLLDTWQEWKTETGMFKNSSSNMEEMAKNSQYGNGSLGTAGGVQPSYTDKKPEYKGNQIQQVGRQNVDQAMQQRGLNKRSMMQNPAQAGAMIAQSNKNQQGTATGSMPVDNEEPNTQISGAELSKDPGFMGKLANMAGVDLKKAGANWKEKGGFDGLMSNPAFSLGLALMQSSANGKTINQGILDNFVKSAKISSEFKDRIEARKQAPIQATSQDVAEVKSLLGSMNFSDPSTLEKFFGKVTGKGNVQMKFDMAAEDIANELEKEMARLQKAVKPGQPPLVFDTTRKFKILERMLNSGKFKKKGGTWFTDATLESTTKIPFEKKAQGGPIQQGKPYLVGEQGPEIIIPHSSGDVLTNDDSQIYAMLLASNPQLQKVSRVRAQKIMRNRFPEYFEG
jgi:hypothetical protein